ncbi:ATP-dependent helicase [Beijerinckia mobilis]|uniref:ATP-dependent helicase n=1 Tax=Beijerinckia mobilis TaxID=231434 RepID=UPI0005544373|nr:UvrD-helicase domain-containing protein [Beijerinckia mobilis]
MNDFTEGLNAEQRAAVVTTEGAVRVIAGAGTGKTKALTQRFCHLIATLGIMPKNILCVTFTNRAAQEMKRRIRAALGDLDLGSICTFHAFCVQLLKEDIHVLHFPKNFIILDMEDVKQIVLKIFTDMGLTLKDTTVQRTVDEVIEAKKLYATTYIDDIYLLDNEQLKARFATARSREDEIFLRYLYEQKKCFGCDFNDLINFATYILEKFPDVREKWQKRMHYVMVDEFQDVSKRQYKLARLLSGKHGNLFIVGDPDQTIYSWRGAHLKLFLDFDKTYPATKTITLTTNYRSTPQILTSSNNLIAKNTIRYPKSLIAAKPPGDRPLYFHAKSDADEARWIADKIRALAAAGATFGEHAVLYRSHYLSRALEEHFVDAQIPYRILSGIAFYSRKEIKDVISYMRMATAADDLAFLRTINTPPRRLGRKKIDRLKVHAEQDGRSLYETLKNNLAADWMKGTKAALYVEAIEFMRVHRAGMALGDALQTFLDRVGYEEFLRLQGDQDRLDNLAELKRAVATMGLDADATLEDFLERVALFTDLDQNDNAETVKLMTIHAVKGMEFPSVFLCGLSEGVFPSRKADTPEAMEEERRLAYVAMTRAMDRLFLSDSEGIANNGLFKFPSRFLFDAGEETIDFAVPLDRSNLTQTKEGQGTSDAETHTSMFEQGERVVHSVFGTGTILDVNRAEASYCIAFDTLDTERNIRFGTALEKIE